MMIYALYLHAQIQHSSGSRPLSCSRILASYITSSIIRLTVTALLSLRPFVSGQCAALFLNAIPAEAHSRSNSPLNSLPLSHRVSCGRLFRFVHCCRTFFDCAGANPISSQKCAHLVLLSTIIFPCVAATK